jgi:nitrogen regulation protein NR(I)
MTPLLLIIDDEPNLRYSLEQSLRSETLDVITAATADLGIELVRRQPLDAVLLDVRLPDMSGLDAFDRIRQIDPRLPVIIMTAYSSTETAIEAMKRGAFEYLLKPVDFRSLRALVERAVELSRLRHVPAVFPDEPSTDDESVDRIVGETAGMRDVYKCIGRVAPLDVPVLIQGESGTGKELVARAIYQHSHRSEDPFLAINCAAIPEGLLESELFGHEKGAFTGADRRRIGKFEQANKGTLLLDEIGDLASAIQPKLLRLLQDQQFERVGGEESIQTDVRVIAATNQNLDEQVAAGRFRSDLLYRLKVYTIVIPPLRDRREDLPLLIAYFLASLNQQYGNRVNAVAPDALQILQSYPWPGNVRELQSVLRYGYIQSDGESITSDSLPDHLQGKVCAQVGTVYSTNQVPSEPKQRELDVVALVNDLLQSGEGDIYEKVCAAVDRCIIETILRRAKGNQVRASEILGISRTTLRAKLRTFGLAIEKQVLS